MRGRGQRGAVQVRRAGHHYRDSGRPWEGQGALLSEIHIHNHEADYRYHFTERKLRLHDFSKIAHGQ